MSGHCPEDSNSGQDKIGPQDYVVCLTVPKGQMKLAFSNDTTEDNAGGAGKCRYLPASSSGDGKMTAHACKGNPPTGKEIRGLCQMSECYTNDYFRCQFPFRQATKSSSPSNHICQCK